MKITFVVNLLFIAFFTKVQADDEISVASIRFDPQFSVIEDQNKNVSVYCEVENNKNFNLNTEIQWFFNGNLIAKNSPCENDNEEQCTNSPHILLLTSIHRKHAGSYSCSFLDKTNNRTISSSPRYLKIYYPPNKANLTVIPAIPIKGGRMVLNCSVDDLGNPPAKHYRWFQNGRPRADKNEFYWIFDPVALDSRDKFSCYAINKAGNGNRATIFVDVYTKPYFIKKLPAYTPVLYTDKNISLTCQVECFPLCSISWYKSGIQIFSNNSKYLIANNIMEADHMLGDFESIQSTLYFNMVNWPNQIFDIEKDSSGYSCRSSNNSVGLGFQSTTYLGVEYPPRDVTLSHKQIYVLEGRISANVHCSAQAFPAPSFHWKDPNGQKILNGGALKLKRNLYRDDSGNYTCVVTNKRGEAGANVSLNVLYKPNCTISEHTSEVLVCEADGNPRNFTYKWEVKYSNESDSRLLRGSVLEAEKSLIKINKQFSGSAIYQCLPGNTVGHGTSCEIEVFGNSGSRISHSYFLLLIASIFYIVFS